MSSAFPYNTYAVAGEVNAAVLQHRSLSDLIHDQLIRKGHGYADADNNIELYKSFNPATFNNCFMDALVNKMKIRNLTEVYQLSSPYMNPAESQIVYHSVVSTGAHQAPLTPPMKNFPDVDALTAGVDTQLGDDSLQKLADAIPEMAPRTSPRSAGLASLQGNGQGMQWDMAMVKSATPPPPLPRGGGYTSR